MGMFKRAFARTIPDNLRAPHMKSFEAERARKFTRTSPRTLLGGRFGYFLFFSARGRGRGSPRGHEGRASAFLIEDPTRGGGVFPGGGGWEGVCGESGNFLGGSKFFFWGPKRPPRLQWNFISMLSNPESLHTFA